MNWKAIIDDFYNLINELREVLGGYRYLTYFTKNTDITSHGVYFFFEQGEYRKNLDELRITRVGTHAVSKNSGSVLLDRLLQHRGYAREGGGNHRQSVFRRHVGNAILNKINKANEYKLWNVKKGVPSTIRTSEQVIEEKVSTHIRKMPFLWLAVLGDSHKDNMRSFIEKNSIALLSNYMKEECVNPPTRKWLGRYSPEEEILKSGLWNIKYTDRKHVDPKFLPQFKELITKMKGK